jgi:hypothetical protein
MYMTAEAPAQTGLPVGLDPLPPSRLADQIASWSADVPRSAALAMPGAGHPARPMAPEEAAAHAFAADIEDLSKWARTTAPRLRALTDDAERRRSDAAEDVRKLDEEIEQRETELAQLRDQLTDQDRRFPAPAGPKQVAILVACVVLAAVEVSALVPVVGIVFQVADPYAWMMAGGIVGVTTGSAWGAGATLHRWLLHEGPDRVRRAIGWMALLFVAIALVGTVGTVAMRYLSADSRIGEGAAASSAATYFAVQAGAVLTSMLHAWWHNDPRVRELRALEAELGFLEGIREGARATESEESLLAQGLAEFDLNAWLARHRSALALEYRSANLEKYRHPLGQALAEAGHDLSVMTLQVLPLPSYVPPVEVDPDEVDWISGFVVTL